MMMPSFRKTLDHGCQERDPPDGDLLFSGLNWAVCHLATCSALPLIGAISLLTLTCDLVEGPIVRQDALAAESRGTGGHIVGDCIVFDVGNNRFRLIGRVRYRSGILYVLRVMDHSEYDKQRWIEDGGCRKPPPKKPATGRRKSRQTVISSRDGSTDLRCCLLRVCSRSRSGEPSRTCLSRETAVIPVPLGSRHLPFATDSEGLSMRGLYLAA
jgi:hypothetical protein